MDILKSETVNYFPDIRWKFPDFLAFHKCIIQKIEIKFFLLRALTHSTKFDKIYMLNFEC